MSPVADVQRGARVPEPQRLWDGVAPQPRVDVGGVEDVSATRWILDGD